jgi:hypothetical protein
MSILSLGQIANTQRSGYQITDKARTAISDMSNAADKSVDTTEQDSATSAAQRSQAKITSFREAAQSAAKDIAQVAFALRATEKLGGELSNLQSLVKKALENPLDAKAFEKLNKAIKSGRSDLNQVADNSQMTLPKADKTKADSQAILPKIDADALLGKEAEITSEADLRTFLTTVENAASQISGLNKEARKLMDSYESNVVHFEISLQNQLAAGSTFPKGDELSILDAMFGNASQATSAQGNRLSPEIMNLI